MSHRHELADDRSIHHLARTLAPRPSLPDAALPDPAAIVALGRSRRLLRRQRRRVMAAAALVLALGAGGSFMVRQRQAAMDRDRADDALLRAVQGTRETPDIGGLGTLVDAAVADGAQG